MSSWAGLDVLVEQLILLAPSADLLHKLYVRLHLVISLSSYQVATFLLNNNNFTQEIALKWEKEVFEKTINDYLAGNLTVPGMNQSDVHLFNNISISFMAQRSISDELVSETK